MGGRQAGSRLHTNSQDALEVECSNSIDLLLKRFSLDTLHDDDWRADFFIDRVNRHDMIMRNGCRSLSFAKKSLNRDGVGSQLRRQHLDRDNTIQFWIMGS